MSDDVMSVHVYERVVPEIQNPRNAYNNNKASYANYYEQMHIFSSNVLFICLSQCVGYY